MDLPLHIQKSIRRYEPIETEGLTLFPVLCGEWDEWLMARPALEFLQQSLPVAFLSKPLLQVYFELDYLPALLGQASAASGLWDSAMMALALALRLGSGLKPEERKYLFSPIVDRDNPAKLRAVRAVGADGKEIEITPIRFRRLRPLIAEQNGLKLESDDANPEMVLAERTMNGAGENLDVSFEQMVASVAALSGMDEAEIYQWPIRKLLIRSDSILRALDYLVCGVGGAFGGFGKNGNPCPHPFFEKKKSILDGMTELSEPNTVPDGAAKKALEAMKINMKGLSAT